METIAIIHYVFLLNPEPCERNSSKSSSQQPEALVFATRMEFVDVAYGSML
ncbi:MAG: hypothetical protein QXT06_04115 [Candidatus Bathyarchaeia archaeon]